MSEDDEQKLIVKFFRTEYPQYVHCLRVSQSGGYRGKGKQGAIRTARVKAMGGITGKRTSSSVDTREDHYWS